MAKSVEKTGGQILVDNLIANGIDRIFSVPGESFLGAMDAFYEHNNEIQFVNCRQEGGAAFMAAAYGKKAGGLKAFCVSQLVGRTIMITCLKGCRSYFEKFAKH